MAAHRKMVHVAAVAAVGLVAGAALAQGPRSPPPGSANHGGQKVCSAVVPDNWRDSINVPASWNARTCADWARSIGAQNYQLGCFFEVRRNGPAFTWGESAHLDGGHRGLVPSTNCGW